MLKYSLTKRGQLYHGKGNEFGEKIEWQIFFESSLQDA